MVTHLRSFFNGELLKATLDVYKDHFKPSPFLEKPNINVSYMVTTAKTKAKNYPLIKMNRIQIVEKRKIYFVGDAKEVSERLMAE